MQLPALSFLGWSYGTYLGAVYTQMFGNTIDRLVLDSSLDPDTYGPRVTRHTAPADAAALRDWARWAAHRDSTYHLGATEDQVSATVDDKDASYAAFTRLIQQLLSATTGSEFGPGSELLDARLELYST